MATLSDVPWAYPNSGFTKDFDMTVSWLAKYLPRSTDADKAENELNYWLWWASHSRIPVFHDLCKKIKLIIRKAYGFRNIQNMLDMVYLVCSNIRIPLPNRKSRNR